MECKHPLLALIKEGEHQCQDFKFEVSDSKKIARSLSAFANSKGGRLLIGVKDNGVIKGVQSDEEYYMIEAASQMYTRPEVPFTSKKWDYQGKIVLQIDIEPGDRKPYLAPDKNDKFKAFVRDGDENRLANKTLMMYWKKQASCQGITIKMSRPVKILLDYLEKEPFINLNQFQKMARIGHFVALHIMSDLLAIELLRYKFQDGRVVYLLNKEI